MPRNTRYVADLTKPRDYRYLASGIGTPFPIKIYAINKSIVQASTTINETLYRSYITNVSLRGQNSQ